MIDIKHEKDNSCFQKQNYINVEDDNRNQSEIHIMESVATPFHDNNSTKVTFQRGIDHKDAFNPKFKLENMALKHNFTYTDSIDEHNKSTQSKTMHSGYDKQRIHSLESGKSSGQGNFDYKKKSKRHRNMMNQSFEKFF